MAFIAKFILEFSRTLGYKPKEKRSTSRARISTSPGVKTTKKGLYRKICATFNESRVKDQKKGLYHEICANFHEFWGEGDKKNKRFLSQILRKAVFDHEFWGADQYFEGFRPPTALQWHKACYFLWGTILAWGAQSSLGEHKH